MQGSEINAILDSVDHFVRDQNGIRKRLAAMHHAMPDRVYVGNALNFRYAGIRRSGPAQDEVERSGNVLQRRGERLLRAFSLLHGDYRFSADPFDLAPQQSHVLTLPDALEVRGDNLKFQAGTAGIENENVHLAFSHRLSGVVRQRGARKLL